MTKFVIAISMFISLPSFTSKQLDPRKVPGDVFHGKQLTPWKVPLGKGLDPWSSGKN